MLLLCVAHFRRGAPGVTNYRCTGNGGVVRDPCCPPAIRDAATLLFIAQRRGSPLLCHLILRVASQFSLTQHVRGHSRDVWVWVRVFRSWCQRRGSCRLTFVGTSSACTLFFISSSVPCSMSCMRACVHTHTHTHTRTHTHMRVRKRESGERKFPGSYEFVK